MRLFVLSIVFAVLIAPRAADACQMTRIYSPLEFLYAADWIVYGEIYMADGAGYHVRHRDTLAGTPKGNETVLTRSDCEQLNVGMTVALGMKDPAPTGYMLYPIAPWPVEPENGEFLVAFSAAKAKGDKAIAKLLVTHAAKGWASYVDFPNIALFLDHAPNVVAAMTKADAKRLRAALNHHPRARSKALDKRAK